MTTLPDFPIHYIMSNCLAVLLAGLVPFMAHAQRLTSYQLSNYAGTNGLYLNPSSIADSRWKVHINVVTASFQAMAQPRLPMATLPFAQASLKLNGQEMAIKQADLRGPAIMVQLRGNHALALTTRYRADVNLSGNYDVVHWFMGDKTALPAADRSIQMNSDAFGEVALSYAVPVLNRNRHYLKLGGTYKYIRGLQLATVTSSGRFEAPAEQMSYALNELQTTYSDLKTLTKISATDVLLGSVPGTGSGFDLGFTYEFRPRNESFRHSADGETEVDPARTKYRLRLGVSLLDIGHIRYQNASSYRVQERSGLLQQATVQPPNTPLQVRDVVAQSLGVVPEGTIGDLIQQLPRTLSVQLDMQLRGGWFVGGAWWKPTGSSPTAAQHRAELVSFGPRFESATVEYGLTGNYWPAFSKLSVGAYGRLRFFTLGTDNLFGFFTDTGLSAHWFAGVTVPIGFQRSAGHKTESAKF